MVLASTNLLFTLLALHQLNVLDDTVLAIGLQYTNAQRKQVISKGEACDKQTTTASQRTRKLQKRCVRSAVYNYFSCAQCCTGA
jgi:hypothetical protein